MILEVLLRTPGAERIESRLFGVGESLHAPHLLDLEVAQVLRRYAAREEITPARGRLSLALLSRFPVTRYPHEPLLPRIWGGDARAHRTSMRTSVPSPELATAHSADLTSHSSRTMIPHLNRRRILALFIANFLGASIYISLSLAVMERARSAGVTPIAFQWSPACWVLLLFLVVNLAWGVLMLASPRPRRWDFYGMVWGLWFVAIFLGFMPAPL